MKAFPNDIKFKYAWRNYQKRVLDELNEHLNDRRLHVVAPPGSGKTVLGLEVVLRLNKPTLILTPSLAIRNQWIQRFCELFLQVENPPEWISRDIRKPGFLTVTTYQALHAACNDVAVSNEEEFETELPDRDLFEKEQNVNTGSIVKLLKEQNLGTIVIDEAHHLKNEWWFTLQKISTKLDCFLVGLTATPPYGVLQTEWNRYMDLNGPIDTEISVPELVIEGDLCPHQDYIFFTLPSSKEQEQITNHRSQIDALFDQLKNDPYLIEAIERHPFWLGPSKNLDKIYQQISYYSACLIFLNNNQREIPKGHLDIIGEKELQIPPFDYEWMEILLQFYLFEDKENFIAHEEHQKKLENKLRRFGALEGKQINFLYNGGVSRLLTSSITKLNAISEIVDFEYDQLKSDLRLVILTDFIRKEYFVNSTNNDLDLHKIGVMSIFEKLRRTGNNERKIGVLTGSMVLIPKSARSSFENLASAKGIQEFSSFEVPYDSNYILINSNSTLGNDVVHMVTQIFQQGEIEILIGTKSLLGEGWDAPAINSLILASFVGSFVLSNQMRGRAIRTQKGNPDKTGNIWHVICIDPLDQKGGVDMDLLKRRFKGFVGITYDITPRIENGTDRLHIPFEIHSPEAVDKKNNQTLQRAGKRERLRKDWATALKSGVRLV